MQPQDVAELLRATASDADAVAQYLLSIDAEEVRVNSVLSQWLVGPLRCARDEEEERAAVRRLARARAAAPALPVHAAADVDAPHPREFLAVVIALHCSLVWNGSPNELDCMQWLTEISLGYLGATQDDNNNSTTNSNMKTRMRVTAIADEIRMLLRIIYELLDDGLQDYGPRSRRVLPQVLGLVPILLGVLADLATTVIDAKKSSSELHELITVVRMSYSESGKADRVAVDAGNNSISVGSAEGKRVAHVTKQLASSAGAFGNYADRTRGASKRKHEPNPSRMRRNRQCHTELPLGQPGAPFVSSTPGSSASGGRVQPPNGTIISILCWNAIRGLSLQHELGVATDSGEERPEDAFRVTLDWRDLIFLFHVLKVSKPVLHHRTTSSRIATDATVFTEIEKLTWSIFQLELSKHTKSVTSRRTPSTSSVDLTKHLTDKVSQVLTFGGTQVHAREWKALLLMDFAFFWMEESERTRFATIASDAKIFQTEEIVSALKNSLQVCQEIQAWAFGRLERVFRVENPERLYVQLRRSSWEEIHRLVTNQLSRFLDPPPPSSSVQHRFSRGGSDLDDEDEEEEDDEHTDSATRFRIGSLVHFYRENTSADGAAAVGLVFQKTLSCLLAFEAAAFATDTCKDGLPVPVIETGGMIHWVTDFVSNLEFFFHWISQSSTNEDFVGGGTATKAPRSRAPTGVQVLEKKVMWQLLARIGIGCALCAVAMDHILGYKDDDQEPAHRHRGGGARDEQLSVWVLLEAQFALHRLLRKLISVHGTAIDVKLSKEYLAASIAGVSSVMDARSALVIAQINASLESDLEDAQTDETRRVGSAASATNSGISFDGVLFALDSCCNNISVADDRSFLRVMPCESQQSHQPHATGDLDIFKSLLTLYFNVRDQVFVAPQANTSHSPRSMFTVYTESFVAKFPKSMRHLVATPRNAKHVVLFDAKAAEDVLVRVFTAIGRVLDAQVETHGVNDIDYHLQRLLNNDDDGNQQEQQGQSPASGFIALAVMLLDDLQAFMSFDELAKLKLTSALLVKRLCDHGASAHASTSPRAFARDMLRLSCTSYAIMCDHVVYHTPLLRVLLSLVFSVHVGKSIEAVIELRDAMEGVLLAAGFEVDKTIVAPLFSRTARPSSSAIAATFAKSNENTKRRSTKERSSAKRRKRLRQLSFDSSDNGEPENGREQIEVDGFADDSSGNVPQPHLASHEAQSAAIHFLVTLVDASHATLLKYAANGTRHGSDEQRRPSSQSVLLYLRSSQYVLHALLTAKDISWIQVRVLGKVLSTIEYGLRLAKAWIAVLTNSKDNADNAASRVSVEVLDACVQLSLRGRIWISALKESIKDATTKTRLSATALKIDVFLLNAPQLVDAYAKELVLTESEKDRLNAMLSSVTKQIIPAEKSTSSLKPETPRKKAHMIGVVPIVKKRKTRLRSRHPYIDECLREEDGDDAFVDLEDFIA
ncbi:hypothetical protein FI667_g2074, partial [Globisporangium splendens]